jgi:hypothetical protein
MDILYSQPSKMFLYTRAKDKTVGEFASFIQNSAASHR